MNWPNGITLLRILLVPALVLTALRVPEHPSLQDAVLVLVLVMAFTDALDGIVARALGQRTALGTFLDPLADKLFLNTGIVLLARPLWPGPDGIPARLVPDWMAVLVVSRDLYLALGGAVLYAMNGTVAIRPRLLGKITTCAQIALLVGSLVRATPPAARYVLVALAAACTVGSWALYTPQGIRQLPKPGDPPRARRRRARAARRMAPVEWEEAGAVGGSARGE